MNLSVAIVQCDIVWENTVSNLHIIGNLLKGIKKEVDLIVLPEMFHCGFSMNPSRNAQKNGGEVLVWMKQMATQLGVTVIGSVVVELDSSFVNRLYVVSSEKVQWYDKRHLFTMGGEHKKYLPGNKRIVVDVKGWRICPLICYDLRFPVWSRNDSDYDVLIYVANWPAARRDVWNALLKARAIENQSFVVGVNRVGKDHSNNYVGDSQVINAKGQNLLHLNNKVQIAYVALGQDELYSFRKKFPVLDDRDDFDISVC